MQKIINTLVMEDEDEDDDDEMADASPGATTTNAADEPPSSLPTLPSPPAPEYSTQPAPSRPAPRKTEVPLPGTRTPINVTSKSTGPLPSSQSLSQSSRRHPRSSQFPSVKEQLSAAKTTATTQKKKAFDPASQRLPVLKKGKQLGKRGAKTVMLSSDEDTSSSSADSD